MGHGYNLSVPSGPALIWVNGGTRGRTRFTAVPTQLFGVTHSNQGTWLFPPNPNQGNNN
jgi:hypothetical protein